MSKGSRERNRTLQVTPQMTLAFPARVRILDPKAREEIAAILARLLLEAARHGSEREVRDDAS